MSNRINQLQEEKLMLDRQKFYDTARVGMILQGTRGYNKEQWPVLLIVFAKEWGLRP